MLIGHNSPYWSSNTVRIATVVLVLHAIIIIVHIVHALFTSRRPHFCADALPELQTLALGSRLSSGQLETLSTKTWLSTKIWEYSAAERPSTDAEIPPSRLELVISSSIGNNGMETRLRKGSVKAKTLWSTRQMCRGESLYSRSDSYTFYS